MRARLVAEGALGAAGICALIALVGAVLAGCGALSGLPEVPATITARHAGLDSLPQLAEEARRLSLEAGTSPVPAASVSTSRREEPQAGSGDPIGRARLALEAIERGDRAGGLAALAAALKARPSDLVLGNAYRMAAYRLIRTAREEARARGERNPISPGFLRDEPLATLERLAAETSGREIRLQVALAYVDRMVLEPALEIRAPASIESVRALTEILRVDPYYVPALVARGLNHLNRPRGLVWPERPGPVPNAASLDFALAAAVGWKVGTAPRHLEETVLTLLGDAYAHEGRPDLARSWWGFARGRAEGAGGSATLLERLAWPDAGISERLERRLEERMADLDDPVSDLSFLWGRGRGLL